MLKTKHLLESPLSNAQLLNLLLATVAAAISGYFAIIWLLDVIRKQKLEWFGVYCFVVSILGLVLVYFG